MGNAHFLKVSDKKNEVFRVVYSHFFVRDHHDVGAPERHIKCQECKE